MTNVSDWVTTPKLLSERHIHVLESTRRDFVAGSEPDELRIFLVVVISRALAPRLGEKL